LSDQYCSRLGYGAPLVIALNKIERMKGGEGIDKFKNLLALFCIFTFIANPFLGMVYSANILFMIMAATIATANSEITYDSFDIRIGKIKQELIGQLKNPNVSIAQTHSAIKDIAAIRDILEKVNIKSSLCKIIYDNLFSPGRKYKNIMDRHNELEALNNNELYEASAIFALGNF
jgi:hypothetical protein